MSRNNNNPQHPERTWTSCAHTLPPQKQDVWLRDKDENESLGCWDTFADLDGHLRIFWLTDPNLGTPVSWAPCDSSEAEVYGVDTYVGAIALAKGSKISVHRSKGSAPYTYLVKASSPCYPSKAIVECSDPLSAARVKYLLEEVQK